MSINHWAVDFLYHSFAARLSPPCSFSISFPFLQLLHSAPLFPRHQWTLLLPSFPTQLASSAGTIVLNIPASLPVLGASIDLLTVRSLPWFTSKWTRLTTDHTVYKTGTATYLVQPDDTCTSIGAIYDNFTLSIFYYWNPSVSFNIPYLEFLC